MNIDSILANKGREVRTVKPEAKLEDALHRMRREGIGALVVSDDGLMIGGILSDRGIMWAIADHGVEILNEPVSRIMTKQVFTCAPDAPVDTLMAMMTDKRIRHIPVVDGEGRLAGIVSIGDVVKHRLDEIEREAEAMREYIAGR